MPHLYVLLDSTDLLPHSRLNLTSSHKLGKKGLEWAIHETQGTFLTISSQSCDLESVAIGLEILIHTDFGLE